jgi:hypothetical protein
MATPCPIGRAGFREQAKPIEIVIGGQPFTAEVKEFSTGSFGWNVNAKTVIEVGGRRLPVQVGLNLTVIGSKEAPKEE